MPLKAGPNGTMRAYSSTNGQYVSMGLDMLLSIKGNSKKPLTKQEKRCNRYLNLLEKAEKSRDPLVYDVFKFIESRFPYCVEHVNEKVYDKNISSTREMDIITHKHIIEIKSGERPGALMQGLAQKDYANKHNKKYIMYAPNILKNTRIVYESKGLIVCKNKEELFQEMRK